MRRSLTSGVSVALFTLAVLAPQSAEAHRLISPRSSVVSFSELPQTPVVVDRGVGVPVLGTSAMPATSGASAGAVAMALLVFAAIAAWLVPGRRRVTALLLTAVGAVLLFESGVHSVHHLGAPPDAARCAVAATSANLQSVSAPTPVVEAPGLNDRAEPLTPDFPLASACPLRPDAGRAPPPSLA